MIKKHRIVLCIENFKPSGGVNFITYYASQLSKVATFDVTIVARNVTGNQSLDIFSQENLRILSLEDFQNFPQDFDLVIGTHWGTFDFTFLLDSSRYAWFVQSLESRFYGAHQTNFALRANAVLHIDIPAITVAPWLAEYLEFEGRTSKIYKTTNGVDKSVFYPKTTLVPNSALPLKIVVEGSQTWYKGLENTIEGISKVAFEAEVTWFSITNEFPESFVEILRANKLLSLKMQGNASQYDFSASLRDADVLVKSSKVEGLPGPHIEAFHCGCTGIFTNVTGIEQFAKHLVNCVLCSFDDPGSITSWLTILNNDRNLLSALKWNALETAKYWPSQNESAQNFVHAVEEILTSDITQPWLDKSDRLNWAKRISQVGNGALLNEQVPQKMEISQLAIEYLRYRGQTSNEK